MSRVLGRAAGVGVVLLSAALIMAIPSPADPADSTPTTASAAIKRLNELSRQAEELNQQQLKVQEDLDRKVAVQQEAERKLAADQAIVANADKEIDRYQPVVNQVAEAMYEGARTGSLFALLGSDDPQQLLDQMTLLEYLGNRTSHHVNTLTRAKSSAQAGLTAAATARDKARAAAKAAEQTRAELRKKSAALSAAAAAVTKAFGELSAKEKQAYAGNPFPPGFNQDELIKSLPKGSRYSALAAALTRIGDPYVWGATGPRAFDCSGLVVWAFRQAGMSVPRTSEQQASAGTPVSRGDLQPGDIVTFYSGASHVGIYAGNGMVLHASTFGRPVLVQALDQVGPYHNARRF